MRYLIVCDYAMTFLGGAQNALIRQAEALHAQGHPVAILAPKVSELKLSPGIERIEPPKVATLPPIGMPLFRNNAKLRKFLNEAFATFKPDAILSHSEFALVAATTQVARELGVASLHTVHTFFWHTPTWTQILTPIGRAYFAYITGFKAPRVKLASNSMDNALRNMTLAACQHADVTISPSRHQGEKIQAAGVTKVAVVSNVTEAGGTPTSLPVGEPFKLAWIGRFSPEKRLEVALEGVAMANRELAASGRSIELHIAGGPAREGYNYVWHGTLDAAGVAKLLTESNAVAVTSLGFDNQPMVVLEAFSHGRPVVLSDPVLGKEFGEAAALTPTPDAPGLAATLLQLVDDRPRMERAAAAAANAAKMATAKVHAEQLESLVREVRG